MNLLSILLGDPLAPILIGVAIGLIVAVLPFIFFLITMSKTLTEVDPKNRKIEPGQVWLSLIPIFGIIWQFMMVNRIADSLKAEFTDRNIQCAEERPGYQIGIVYAILIACSIIPFLGNLAALGGLVCWIMYWVKIAGFKTLIITAKGGSTM